MLTDRRIDRETARCRRQQGGESARIGHANAEINPDLLVSLTLQCSCDVGVMLGPCRHHARLRWVRSLELRNAGDGNRG